MPNHEFEQGDEIIMIGGMTPYYVLRVYLDEYQIMSHDVMHLCSTYDRKYIEGNFILVSKFNEREDEDA